MATFKRTTKIKKEEWLKKEKEEECKEDMKKLEETIGKEFEITAE